MQIGIELTTVHKLSSESETNVLDDRDDSGIDDSWIDNGIVLASSSHAKSNNA